AILEHRNAHVMRDLELELDGGPRGRRIAVFYGAGHLPDLDRRLRERGLEFQGVEWHRGWSVTNERPPLVAAARGLDGVVRDVAGAHGDAGLELSVWLGGDDEAAVYTWNADAVHAAASSIKTAYLVELFAEFEGRLDAPFPGLDAILDDPAQDAPLHFDAAQRQEIARALRGASVRRLAQLMVHGRS